MADIRQCAGLPAGSPRTVEQSHLSTEELRSVDEMLQRVLTILKQTGWKETD